MRANPAVVVPVGPGDDAWRVLLPQLLRLAFADIVVVFPAERASEQPWPALADARVQVTFAPRGRARQLNAGAAATSADWIWFLHADSVVTDRCVAALARHMARPARSLGYFDLRFLDDGPVPMALNSIGAWMRSRWLGLPFGDQGFVVSRRLFDRLGGFDEALAQAEDHDLIWRARAIGADIVPVGACLYTSARKYALNGWWRTTTAHLAATWRQAWTFSRRART